jgi:hypothetical protein
VEIMAKRKNKKILRQRKSKGKPKAKPLDPNIEEVYEETIWFNCPQRGRVSQKVKVKKYKSLVEQMKSKHILDSKDPLDRIESEDDGLSIYNDGEELGITGEKE